MTGPAERYERARLVFFEALDVPPGERAALIASRTSGDPDLASEVLSLLAAAEDTGARALDSQATRVRERVHAILDEATGGWPMPERIGPFEVRRCLGEGGMGIVYEAEQQAPRRRVAVKVVRPGRDLPGLMARFHRETELLGRLQHPGIARIYEAGEASPWGPEGPRVPYLVMELVEGEPVTVHAARLGLTATQRLEIVARLCEAVQHAHEKGIIHRDLKPANVLVDAEGRPRVLDFGVARALGPDQKQLTVFTGTSQLVGTLPYMSPEQVSGRPDQAGPASDVYALGVIAYELLAGRLPLQLAGLPLTDAAREVADREPTRLGAFHRELKGDVEIIVSKALAKEPARRYANAGEMAADIRRYLSGQPVLAHPPSALYRARRFTKRHRGLVAALAALGLVLVAGLVATTWLALEQARSRREAVAAAAEARRGTYRAELNAALAALDDADPLTALAHLRRAPEELREWTHAHATQRTDDSLGSLRIGGAVREPGLTRVAETPSGDVAVISEDGFDLVVPAIGEMGRKAHLDGKFVELSADGAWVLEDARGEWHVRSTASPGDAPIALGPAGPLAFPLTLGGWLLSHPDGCSIVGADGSRRRFGLLLQQLGDVQAVSPDGSIVAVRGDRKQSMVEIAGGRRSELPRELSGTLFLPDGRHVVTHDGRGEIQLWKTLAFEAGPLATLSTQARLRQSVLSAGSSGALLAVNQRGDVRILDPATLHSGRVAASLGYFRQLAAWKPGSATFVVPDGDGALHGFTTDGEPLGRPFLGLSAKAAAICWLAKTGRVAVLGEDGVLRLFLEPGAVEPRLLPGHRSFVYSAAISPDGARIASAAWDGTVRVWDARTGAQLREISLGESEVGRAACWAGADRLFVLAGERLMSWDGRGELRAESAELGLTRDIAWDAKRSRVVAADAFGRLVAWDGTSSADLLVVEDRGAARVRLSARGDFAVLSMGSSVHVVDLASGAKRWGTRTEDEVLRTAVSPDGSLVLAACRRGLVLAWDAADGTERARLEVPGGASVLVVELLPGGILVTGSQDGVIHTWDFARREPLGRLLGHADYVHDIAVSPDGTWMVSASGDSTLRIWDSLPLRERLR